MRFCKCLLNSEDEARQQCFSFNELLPVFYPEHKDILTKVIDADEEIFNLL
jgi:hypothetical protein